MAFLYNSPVADLASVKNLLRTVSSLFADQDSNSVRGLSLANTP